MTGNAAGGSGPTRLERAFAALFGHDSAALVVGELDGGLSNASYLVASGGEHYVLRLSRGAVGATLAADAEFDLLRAVAAAGLTPAAIGIDREARALVTRFARDAVPLTPASAREKHNIERIAAVLRRLHRVTALLRDYDPVAYAATYLSAATALEPLGLHDRRRAADLEQLARDYQRRYPATVVCHNDLVAANVLDDGELTLIDFEYAARGAPVLDLASVAAMNDYESAHRRALLNAYFGADAIPDAEFAKVVRMVELIAHFWALATPQDT